MKKSHRDPAPLDLNRFLPYLIYRVVAQTAAIAAADYAAWGIGVREARVLLIMLSQHGIGAGELSEAACVEASALSHMLRHLAAKKLIRRVRRPDERRSVQVFLTKTGAVVARKCHVLGVQQQEQFLEGLSGAEVYSLRKSLRRITVNLTEQSSAPTVKEAD
jgi:DNA-binding MarR family transcriptional regulator